MVDDISFNIFTLFFNASFLVKTIILLLLFASFLCWAIAIERFVLYGKIVRNICLFEKIFFSGRSLEEIYGFYISKPSNSDIVLIFIAAVEEWRKLGCNNGNLHFCLDRIMNLAINRTILDLEKYLVFLANISSSAPFIGLFGTVIGIISAFSSIAHAKNSSLAIVAPGIAEALLATAIGLFAAIPAVILYNKLIERMNYIIARLDNFSDELLCVLSQKSLRD